MISTALAEKGELMPKVYCAAMDCEFNGYEGKCHAKSIALADQSVMTLWEGRQRFNTCRTYQESQLSKDIDVAFEKFKEKLEEQYGK